MNNLSHIRKYKRESFVYKLTLLIALLLLLEACSTSVANEDKKNQTAIIEKDLINVKAIQVQKGTFYDELVSNGKLYAQEKADLYFRIIRPIEKINFKNGEYIHKGDTIAILENNQLLQEVIQAQINYDRAILDYEDFLLGKGYYVNDTLPIPEEIIKSAKIRSGLRQAEASYNLAKINYEQSILIAPMNGTIANLFVQEMNMPSQNQQFCTIINSSYFYVEFPVLESELGQIQKGQKVTVSPYFDAEKKYEGVVDIINPAINDNGMIVVFGLVKNIDNSLKQGMNVTIKLQQALKNQLFIPKEAVTIRSDKDVVFTVKDSVAQWNYVKIADENSMFYTISKGISEGDWVVVKGNTHLANNTPVNATLIHIQ